MTNSKFLKMFLFFLLACTVFTSCDKEDMDEDYDIDGNFSTNNDDDDYGELEFDDDCFEFTYPVDIVYPDGSTVTYNDEDDLEDAIEDWDEQNPGATDIPLPVLPITLTLPDGSETVIDSEDSFLILLANCEDDDDYPDDYEDEFEFDDDCFEFMYPVDIVYPDGSTVTYDDEDALEDAIEDWAEQNPDATNVPLPVFPVTLTLEDGSETVMENEGAFMALLLTCED